MIRKLSPAKINFCLRVLGRRPDGYHEIVSLMHPISLSDELTFHPSGDKITLHCNNDRLPLDEGNIVFRAARMIFAFRGFTGGVDIEIIKRIPLAAGLGGGSSNAAATLLALNDLFDLQLTTQELLRLAVKLGADVPFFIIGKPAWARGIGEILSEAPRIPPCWMLLLNPGFEVSTATVYGRLNLGLTRAPADYSIAGVSSRDDLIGLLRNDLEAAAAGLHPAILEMKGYMKAVGALGTSMSGSGPTVFGIFSGRKQAGEAAKALRRLVPPDWLITITRSI